MDDPQPQVAPEPVVIAGFKGIKNTVTPERLSAEDLERAINIDLDDAGQVRRRRGYTLAAAGSYHSLFTAQGGTIYGVKDNDLGIIRADYAFTVLRGGVGPQPVAYVQVGEDIYFSSATTSGVIHSDETVTAWGALVSPGEWHSPVVNPTTTLPAIAGKVLGAPPLATSLAYYNGRIYLANGKTLWATELFLYGLVDKTRTYLQFESDITMVGAVSNGLYVGTRTAVWFLSGAFNEMRRVIALDAGAVPHSMVTVPTDVATRSNEALTRATLMFMSERGVCLCQDGGIISNLTQTKVLMPTTIDAAAMLRQQDGINQYVGVLTSPGVPTSTARVGDYIDAEIRRFQGALP